MTKPISTEYAAPNNATVEIPVIEIRPSALNPRKHFAEASLEELTNSIRVFGVEQAITVRPTDEEGMPFEIVMGERRWRAACAAGLTTIPARVAPCTDEELVSRALVENLVRSDLSCMEIAHGYKALSDKGWTQEKIAQQFSTDQPQVSLLLGLLKLPEYVQGLLESQRLSKSHGFALLTIADEQQACSWLAKVAIDESLSEKELRDRVRAKRQELDDKKQQPRLPLEGAGKVTTTKTTTETTTTPAAPPVELPSSGKPAPEVKENYTPADAKKEFEASQNPDPDVPRLSELPSSSLADLPAPSPEATGAVVPVPVAPAKELGSSAKDEPLKQAAAPVAATGKSVGVHIDQRWDDWLWEHDLETVDAALEQLATLRQRPQLSAMAHKCLKAICPEGLELSTFLEDVLIGRARTEGIDINTLIEIPE